MEKERLIQEIIMAVQAQAETTKNTHYATRQADGDLFLALAFRTVEELKEICKNANIPINN